MAAENTEEQVALTAALAEEVVDGGSSAAAGEEEEKKESGVRQICFALFVNRIKGIELVNQIFMAEGQFTAGWKGTKEMYEEYQHAKRNKQPYEHEYDLLKSLKFRNGDVDYDTKDVRVLKLGDIDYFGGPVEKIQWEYTCVTVVQYSGTFTENFELQNFPMDVQDLQMRAQLMESTKSAILLPWYPAAGESWADWGFQLTVDKSTIEEYELCGAYFTVFETKYGSTMSTINYEIKIRRKVEVYLWKIVLVSWITTACSFLTFTMDINEDLGDVYGLLTTLLLTAAAFQYVVSESLPDLPYLTWMDKYIIMSFVVIFAVIVEVAILSFFEIEKDSPTFFWIAVITMIFFLIEQAGLYWQFRYLSKKELDKLEKNYFVTDEEEEEDSFYSKPFNGEYGAIDEGTAKQWADEGVETTIKTHHPKKKAE